MARTYAGILGLLAFATVVARGIAKPQAADQTIWQAVLQPGCVRLCRVCSSGVIAQWIVDDSVRGRLATRNAKHGGESRQRSMRQRTAATQ